MDGSVFRMYKYKFPRTNRIEKTNLIILWVILMSIFALAGVGTIVNINASENSTNVSSLNVFPDINSVFVSNEPSVSEEQAKINRLLNLPLIISDYQLVELDTKMITQTLINAQDFSYVEFALAGKVIEFQITYELMDMSSIIEFTADGFTNPELSQIYLVEGINEQDESLDLILSETAIFGTIAMEGQQFEIQPIPERAVEQYSPQNHILFNFQPFLTPNTNVQESESTNTRLASFNKPAGHVVTDYADMVVGGTHSFYQRWGSQSAQALTNIWNGGGTSDVQWMFDFVARFNTIKLSQVFTYYFTTSTDDCGGLATQPSSANVVTLKIETGDFVADCIEVNWPSLSFDMNWLATDTNLHRNNNYNVIGSACYDDAIGCLADGRVEALMVMESRDSTINKYERYVATHEIGHIFNGAHSQAVTTQTSCGLWQSNWHHTIMTGSFGNDGGCNWQGDGNIWDWDWSSSNSNRIVNYATTYL